MRELLPAVCWERLGRGDELGLEHPAGWRAGRAARPGTGWRARPGSENGRNWRSVTRLGWLRLCAEGRTENKLQKEREVGFVFSWPEQHGEGRLWEVPALGWGGWTEQNITGAAG